MPSGDLRTVDIQEAEAQLPELVKRAEEGTEIVISRIGEPVAKLIPLPADFDLERSIAWEGEIQLKGYAEEMCFASAGPLGGSR
jgi:prevent-host-death family protein